MNLENQPTHMIRVEGEPVYYRANSRLYRYVDPTIVDPHSIQTYSSNNVFLIVKNKLNKWVHFVLTQDLPPKSILPKTATLSIF